MMTRIEKLLSVSSESLAENPATMPKVLEEYRLGKELFRMLQMKNGFYAFEQALHVFPITSDPIAGLEGWNSDSLWRSEYRDMAQGLLCFAEDIFQDQFCLSGDGVVRFKAETGKTGFVADSIEKWADVILVEYKVETGWPLAHEWQLMNGPLPSGKRLMPRTPFFLGGEYKIENLWAGDRLEGMRFKADLAMQTRNLPEGAKIRLNFSPKPR